MRVRYDKRNLLSSVSEREAGKDDDELKVVTAKGFIFPRLSDIKYSTVT